VVAERSRHLQSAPVPGHRNDRTYWTDWSHRTATLDPGRPRRIDGPHRSEGLDAHRPHWRNGTHRPGCHFCPPNGNCMPPSGSTQPMTPTG
jgi:hypothetical protein